MRQLKITKSITNRESASLDKYLQEIGREDLITVEEEVELAQRIRKGFIILKANGQPVKSVNDLEDVLKAATQSPDQVLFLSGMFPSGKRANYAVDLTQE